MGLWKASAAPGIRGVPEHPWHHGNGIDYLRVVGQQDNPPVLPGGRGSSRQQLGEVNSLLPPGAGLPAVDVRQGRRKGQGHQRQGQAGSARVLLCGSTARSDRDSVAITEHLVRMLPKNRSLPSSTSKETVLEGVLATAGLVQGGVSFTGSLPLGATDRFRGVILGPAISLRQDPRV